MKPGGDRCRQETHTSFPESTGTRGSREYQHQDTRLVHGGTKQAPQRVLTGCVPSQLGLSLLTPYSVSPHRTPAHTPRTVLLCTHTPRFLRVAGRGSAEAASRTLLYKCLHLLLRFSPSAVTVSTVCTYIFPCYIPSTSLFSPPPLRVL